MEQWLILCHHPEQEGNHTDSTARDDIDITNDQNNYAHSPNFDKCWHYLDIADNNNHYKNTCRNHNALLLVAYFVETL